MNKALFLSAFCLVCISPLAYGSWHMTNINVSNMQPKGDCLEMLCSNGCLEDDKGNANCCSAGNLGDKCWGGLCCQKGLVCSSATDEGTCVECVKNSDCEGGLICSSSNTCGNCPTGKTPYINSDGKKDCCNNATHKVFSIAGGTTQTCCTNACAAGGVVPKGTIFDEKTMTRGQNCSCDCLVSLNWTKQNKCCIPVERVDGTFDCKNFSYSNAYDLHNPNVSRPYDKTEFSGAYKQDHNICLTVRGVDDDIIVKVGNTSYGPFWNNCAGLAADKTNNHKLNKKYFVPANKLFELKIRDICRTNVGINYSIDFCDE